MFLDETLKVVREERIARSGNQTLTPMHISFDRRGDRILVSAAKEKAIVVYDHRTDEQHEMSVGERCWYFSLSPDEKKLVAACGRSNNVFVFDAKTYARLAEIPLDQCGGACLPWGVVTYPKAMETLDEP